jgi:DNA-binding transcriptional MerR regulator
VANQKLNDRLYYSISEVAKITKLEPYVLRFWEKEFPVLKPKKNRAGNRTYQLKDIELVNRIKALLYEQGYTIPGAKAKLKEDRNSDGSASSKQHLKSVVSELKKELQDILDLLRSP